MRIFVLCVCAVLAAVIAPIAAGSQLIDRNASQVSLKVNAKGEALMTYKAGGNWTSFVFGARFRDPGYRLIRAPESAFVVTTGGS